MRTAEVRAAACSRTSAGLSEVRGDALDDAVPHGALFWDVGHVLVEGSKARVQKGVGVGGRGEVGPHDGSRRR